MTVNNARNVLIGWFVCGLGALFYCYEFFLRISPSMMTQELMRAYHLDGEEVGHLVALYYHAYVPMQLVVGVLMDRYGPRLLLTLACVCCAIGTFLFAGEYGLLAAQWGRFLVGFGSAFAFVGALKLSTIWLPPNRFALVSGLITTLGMLGAMFGDILLHVLMQAVGWHLTNQFSALAGIVLAAILWMMIRDQNPSHAESHSDRIHFKELFQGLFQALKNRYIWLCGFIGAVLYLSLSAFAELWGIPYLREAHHFSVGYAATANSMIFLGWAIGGPWWGWFSDRISRRKVPLFWGTLGACILITLLLYLPNLSVATVYLLLFGFGFLCSAEILIFAICHEVMHSRMAGTAIALANMVVMLGGNIFQPLIGRLLDSHWMGMMQNGARVYLPQNYQAAFTFLPISMIFALVAITLIEEDSSRSERA